MQLGTFSVSLAVDDIHASLAFYEKFGFAIVGGDIEQNWLILRNAEHTIGLFQGMFEKNTLTFNPGWDRNANELKDFTDIRQLQQELTAKGVELFSEGEQSEKGPTSFIAIDPDGNPILVDQHVG